jgi:hypothetical protein
MLIKFSLSENMAMQRMCKEFAPGLGGGLQRPSLWELTLWQFKEKDNTYVASEKCLPGVSLSMRSCLAL